MRCASGGYGGLMLMLAVLGLSTTHRTRSDIEHQWLPGGFSADSINRQLGKMSGDAELNLLLNQFHALVRKGSDSSSEVIFDDPFRHRFSRVVAQAARANWRRWDDEKDGGVALG